MRKDLEPLKATIEEIGLEWPEGTARAKFEFENRIFISLLIAIAISKLTAHNFKVDLLLFQN